MKKFLALTATVVALLAAAPAASAASWHEGDGWTWSDD